jgi:hypothetical protein
MRADSTSRPLRGENFCYFGGRPRIKNPGDVSNPLNSDLGGHRRYGCHRGRNE